jgi:hypothetical protein
MASTRDLESQSQALIERLQRLAREAEGFDPALRDRLEAAMRALRGSGADRAEPPDLRQAVRDLLAEELDRFWERRFGRPS